MLTLLVTRRALLTAALGVLGTTALLTQGALAAGKDQAPGDSVALEGRCPVCVATMNKWVPGKPEHQATYDGKTYYFPSEKEKRMFVADPARFVPALGGDCTVCFAKMGKRVAGDIRHSIIHGGRLFLFPGADEKAEFRANPEAYTDADLALDGNCAVCKAMMDRDVPGKPKIAAFHQGLRYLFPSPKERKMFLADPDKFAVKPAGDQAAADEAANGERPENGAVVVRGTSACAGCEHGVTPIGAPDTLGLAVNADDGQVYVVEDAHKLYPDVYERRFEGLPVEVSGTVLRSKGKITWIQPEELKVLN